MSEIIPPNTPPPIMSPVKTSALAVWSLVLGILSLICFSFVAAIPAVICGHLGLSKIKRSGGTLTGDGLAIAGLVTGYLGLAIAVFMVPMLMAIAIPNFVRARDTAQRNMCINNLRMIDAAKHKWALEHTKADTDTPTEQDLQPYLRGTVFPHCPKEGVYTLQSVAESPTCSVAGHVLP